MAVSYDELVVLGLVPKLRYRVEERISLNFFRFERCVCCLRVFTGAAATRPNSTAAGTSPVGSATLGLGPGLANT